MKVPSANLKPVVVILLGLLVAACTVSVPPQDQGVGNQGDGVLETQVAQIATNQSHLATEVGRLGDSLQQLDEDNVNQDEIISYMLTQMPTRQYTPYPNLTITPTPYVPVTGAVLIEEGRCCAGGKLGEVLEVQVQFEAISQFGEVVEMRVLAGGTLNTLGIADSPWEPYAADKLYPVEIQIANWVGWWVTVQYRDEAGNVSPIYFDDISIEGMLAAPTPTE